MERGKRACQAAVEGLSVRFVIDHRTGIVRLCDAQDGIDANDSSSGTTHSPRLGGDGPSCEDNFLRSERASSDDIQHTSFNLRPLASVNPGRENRTR